MKPIGMIGLGVMGHSVAEHILAHGYEMILYDLRPEAFNDLVARGAQSAASLPELGKHADTILLMVNTYPQCHAALTGLLETMEAGTIINLSTIAPSDAVCLQQLAADHGVSMLDCPVSGGAQGAKAGTLTLMAAGDEALLEAHRPLLRCFGQNICHAGTKAGQGQTVKAINQLLVGIHMCATAEAFTLAAQCGLDLNMVYETICASAGTSRIFENRGRYLIDRDFSTRSTLQIQLKDTDIVCQTADAAGAPAFLANTARELFKLAVNSYPPTDDSISVARLYEALCRPQQA